MLDDMHFWIQWVILLSVFIITVCFMYNQYNQYQNGKMEQKIQEQDRKKKKQEEQLEGHQIEGETEYH